jgi:enamine deaminase RidA (YjgF/YER057c/UK114 family)
VLPRLDPPRGLYQRTRRAGDVVYVAGHGPPPGPDGTRPTGRVGAEHDVAAARGFARGAGLAIIASLRDELGELSAVRSVLRVFGMVAVAPGFDATPAVIDGCSEVLLEVFGAEVGGHARSAIGVAALPYGLPVEVEATVSVWSSPRGWLPQRRRRCRG